MALLLLAFVLGMVAGLRSLTAPAAVCWAAHLGWLDLRDSPLAFLGSTIAVCILSVGAIGELIADKLPFTPSRLTPGPLGARIVLGGLCGAALYAASHGSLAIGAIVGAVGSVAGSYAGYTYRTRLLPRLGLPDIVIALSEDAIAILTAFFIVSRG